jgi:hypothetical protein
MHQLPSSIFSNQALPRNFRSRSQIRRGNDKRALQRIKAMEPL